MRFNDVNWLGNKSANLTHLVESKTFRTDPRVLRVLVAIVEDFAVQILVGVVSGVLVGAVELGVRQQQR